MPTPPTQYSNLLSTAKELKQVGSSIDRADAVYYECRSILRYSQKYSPSSGVFYQGKLNSIAAECVAVSPPGNVALSGRIITFVCLDKPEEQKLFQRKKTDKGSWGILRRDVTCRIDRKFENIPDCR